MLTTEIPVLGNMQSKLSALTGMLLAWACMLQGFTVVVPWKKHSFVLGFGLFVSNRGMFRYALDWLLAYLRYPDATPPIVFKRGVAAIVFAEYRLLGQCLSSTWKHSTPRKLVTLEEEEFKGPRGQWDPGDVLHRRPLSSPEFRNKQETDIVKDWGQSHLERKRTQ